MQIASFYWFFKLWKSGLSSSNSSTSLSTNGSELALPDLIISTSKI